MYESKNWVDRSVEFPNRYSITCIDEVNGIYEINRLEGKISEEGDALDSQNFNDQENRILNAFKSTESLINTVESDINNRISSLMSGVNSQIESERNQRFQMDASIQNDITSLRADIYSRLAILEDRVARLERG